MYKVLIADDERIIREGLSNGVCWADYGFQVCGVAENGLTALERLKEQKPELAVVDIKMPGMDGLSLIEQAQSAGLETTFVILSGYSEFEYAKSAMRFGVKYYLTKPCTDEDLSETLQAVHTEIEERLKKERILKRSAYKYEQLLSGAEEQMFRKALDGEIKSTQQEDLLQLSQFGIDKIRIAVFRFQAPLGAEASDRFFRIMMQQVKGKHFIRCMRYQNDVVAVFGFLSFEEVRQICAGTGRWFQNGVPDSFHALSAEGLPDFLRELYEQCALCLEYDLRMEERSQNGLLIPVFRSAAAAIDTGALERCILADQLQEVRPLLERAMEPYAQDVRTLKTACLVLCLNLFFRLLPEDALSLMQPLADMTQIEQAGQVQNRTLSLILEAAAQCGSPNVAACSPTMRKIVTYIQKNMENPNLSLSQISKEVLFMNEDYIGKLFSKEMGKRFSQYLTSVRIRKAIQLFHSENKYKIFEISSQTGFGTNTQYFSQVFKKHLGFTPSEFQQL